MTLFNNPIIQRYRCSLMRPAQMWIHGAVYALVVGMILLINGSIYRNATGAYKNVEELCASLFLQFLILMVAMLWFWGGYNSGSAIRDEMVEKSYDFFRLLPLSPGEKAVGILVGKNLVMLVLAAFTAVLMAITGMWGNVGIGLLVQVFMVLAAIGILAHLVTLLTSQLVRVRKKSSSSAGALLLGIFLFPYVIAIIVGMHQQGSVANKMGGFYGIRMPVLILTTVIALYYAAWAAAGVLRLFRYEGVALFSRGGALGFMAGYLVVILGLFWPFFPSAASEFQRELYAGFLVASFVPLALLPFGSVRTFENYLELAGTEGGPVHLSWVLRKSNLALGAGLFLLWACAAVLVAGMTAWRAGTAAPILLVVNVGVLFSYYIFLLLLVELGVVNLARYPKLGILLGAIVIVHSVLPLIMAGIFQAEQWVIYSPFGFWATFFAEGEFGQFEPLIRVFAVNVLLCLIPAWLVLRRYLEIPAAREKMQSVGSR